MPNIITKGLIPIQQKNHRVILEYISPYSRKEKAVFNFPPLKWQKVSKFLDSDIIILNMISGWDINKNTYLKLCERVRKKLYLDVHFLVMGVDKLGKRFPQRPDNIRDWLRGARYIQMNHREFEIITDKSLSEKEFFQEYFISDQVLIITKGRNGATAVYKEHGQIKTEDVPAPQLKTLVDTTGCGDAFGSGFVYGLLKKLHLKDALKFANCVAAANALLRGTNEMHRLKETMKNLQCGEVD
ncbi:MAG: carbohydrate kinase family protein [Calditrichia bacterium]